MAQGPENIPHSGVHSSILLGLSFQIGTNKGEKVKQQKRLR